MAFRRRSLTLIVCGVILVPILFAQTPVAQEPEARFRVVALDQQAELLVDVDGKREIINAGLGNFSRLLPVPANHRVIFFREEPNPDPQLPPLRVPQAEAQLPTGEGPFLVMLYQASAGATLPYGVQVLDQSLASFPVNHYRVFNYSKRRMAVRLADKDMLLARGQSEIVPFPDTRKAWLKVAAEDDEEGWLVVTSSSHAVGSETRTTVFLVDIPPSERDPNPKGVTVRRIREQISTNELGQPYVR